MLSLLVCIPVTACALLTVGQPGRIEYAGPLVITEGGTYQGSWESQDPDVPVVEIRTTEPVAIEDSHMRGRGQLIASSVDGANLTVRDSVGVGLNPGREGVVPGRFVDLHEPAGVVLESNELLGTAGIRIDGFSGARGRDSIKVVSNRVTNIDGRPSTGEGFGTRDADAEYVQFVQLVMVSEVPGVEIGWNEIHNEPGASRVEDVISVYLSSGVAESPISVHDNYIDGAYPADARTDTTYTGGGIMLGDGSDARSPVRFVEGIGNTVVNTTNYGIAVSSGHDVVLRTNRVMSAGRLDDGATIPAQNVGLYVANLYDQDGFGPVDLVDNLVGWEQPTMNRRNDYYTPDARESLRNAVVPGAVSSGLVEQEHHAWLRRASAAGVSVGPRR